MLEPVKPTTSGIPADTGDMTLIAFIAIPLAVMGAVDVLAWKFGAEDRPGFDERRPLS